MVNGTPSRFFTASRGIRHGCPLSPLLFILVIEGLSLLIRDAKAKGKIRGIKISDSLYLTHLLFVADVILFGMGTVVEWIAFDVILETFCSTLDMSISMDKSGFLFNELDLGILHSIQHFIPYKADPIQLGFKYLGFYIKPLGYKVEDWYWLVKDFERRIHLWYNKYLSLGGRLVLIQAVLSSMLVY